MNSRVTAFLRQALLQYLPAVRETKQVLGEHQRLGTPGRSEQISNVAPFSQPSQNTALHQGAIDLHPADGKMRWSRPFLV
jgi:hypothetical protein